MHPNESKIQFDVDRYARKRRLAQLLLRQAAMQFAILDAFERNQGQHIHTETLEPMPRYNRQAIQQFNHKHLSGTLDEFEFQVTMSDDMSGTVVTWDGQDELGRIMGTE